MCRCMKHSLTQGSNMESVDRLFADLVGTDPYTGVEITIANCESAYWDEDMVPRLINQALDEGEKFVGVAGLDGLHRYDVTLNVGLSSSHIWPGFSIDPATISRLCASGAEFGFDPYISDVPDITCELNTTDDFTVHFSAMKNPDERTIIACRPLRECTSWIEDIYTHWVFREALKFHGDNSLRGFRKKLATLTYYCRNYSSTNCMDEGCHSCEDNCVRPSFSLSRSTLIRLNAANASFVYIPFTRSQKRRK